MERRTSRAECPASTRFSRFWALASSSADTSSAKVTVRLTTCPSSATTMTMACQGESDTSVIWRMRPASTEGAMTMDRQLVSRARAAEVRSMSASSSEAEARSSSTMAWCGRSSSANPDESSSSTKVR